MKLNFKILAPILQASEHPTGITINEMKDAVEWGTCPNQVQAVIDHIINNKFVKALPIQTRGGNPLPTRWVTNRYLRTNYKNQARSTHAL